MDSIQPATFPQQYDSHTLAPSLTQSQIKPLTLLPMFLARLTNQLIQLGPHKEVMIQGLLRTQPLLGIELQQALQKGNRLTLGPTQGTLLLVATAGPHHDPLQREALLADGLDVGLEHGAVHGGAHLHALPAEDAGHLDHGVDVVGGVEEGEAARQQGQQDHARGPDVDLGGLRRAFEEHFWGAEATGAGPVGAARGPGVVFRVAGGEAGAVGLLGGEGEGRHVALSSDVAVLEADAGLPVRALLFGEAEVDKDAAPFGVVVQEVGGFDVAVQDPGAVDGVKGREEGVEVVAHVGDEEVAVVEAEVEVAEVGQHGYYLVQMSEGG